MIRPRSAFGGFCPFPGPPPQSGEVSTTNPRLAGEGSIYAPPLAGDGRRGRFCRTEPQSARLSHCAPAQARGLVFDASILRASFAPPYGPPKGEGRQGLAPNIVCLRADPGPAFQQGLSNTQPSPKPSGNGGEDRKPCGERPAGTLGIRPAALPDARRLP